MLRKCVWLGILPILCSLFSIVEAAWDCCEPYEVTVPNCDCGIEFSGAFLYLQPSAGNLGWGVVTDFLPFVSPQWHVKRINPNYHPAFNVGLGYQFCGGLHAQVNWTQLRCHDSQCQRVIPIQQWISPFTQTGPGTGDPTYDPTGVGELIQGRAKLKFHYDALNWDLGTFVQVGPNMKMRIFSGLSGVRIKQELRSRFHGANFLPSIALNNSSTYTGIGPRIGFDCAWDLYNGFSFVGQVAGALLFGTTHPAQYRFTGVSTALQAIGITRNKERVSSDSVRQTVPAFDARLGINYVYEFCSGALLSIEAGYMGAFYVRPLSGYEPNTNVLPLELGSLSTNSMRHIESDFSVNGPYVGMEFVY